MIIDKRTEFADNVLANTGAAGTYNIGDQIDLGLTDRDLGVPDTPLYLVVQVGAAGLRVAAGTGTVAFQLVSDGTPTPAVNGTQVIHVRTRDYATSTTSDAGALRPGTVLGVFQMPIASGQPYRRYLGVQQVTGTTAISAGRVAAFLTPTPPTWKAYDGPWQV